MLNPVQPPSNGLRSCVPPAPPLQVGYDMTSLAARRCFAAAGLEPSSVDVVELHDCFSANELITYEALGLCPEGQWTRPPGMIGHFVT